MDWGGVWNYCSIMCFSKDKEVWVSEEKITFRAFAMGAKKCFI